MADDPKSKFELIEESLFYSDSTANDLVIEASLRSASLLGLNHTLKVEPSFVTNLKCIYQAIRFSVDIADCILFKFVNGLWWEAIIIIQDHKFNDEGKWEKIDKNQFDTIEAMYQIRQEVTATEDTSTIGYFLSHENIHFERFRSLHGGVAFKPTDGDHFTQYDQAFLTHVAAFISFCIDKDSSSKYLKEVYQNLQGIDDKLKSTPENKGATPAMYTSPITALHSRLGFLRIIKHIVDTCQLNSYIAILSMDHDGDFLRLLDEDLKQSFLQKAIARLESIVPDNNTLSHLGATDFAFIIVNTEESVILNTLSQIKDAFITPLHVDGYRMSCEIRAGYSCYSNSSIKPEELLKKASIALYQAQNTQTENIIKYNAGIVHELQFNLELSQSLSKAIDNDEFDIFLQPVVPISRIGKPIQHYEALIRWQHPERGMVAPEEFISIAEKNGTIIRLGYWVINRVCQQLSMPCVPEEVSISVNLSPLQLEEPDLVENILEILNQYSIATHRITIEITESSAMQDNNLTKKIFSKFHSAGFILSMDDFGTGYSSLSYLLNFPFDILKIDKSFIANTLNDQQYTVIGRAVVTLAHDLSLLVVCEGIETDEQLQMVKSWKADMIQGYLISPPEPWSHFY